MKALVRRGEVASCPGLPSFVLCPERVMLPPVLDIIPSTPFIREFGMIGHSLSNLTRSELSAATESILQLYTEHVPRVHTSR